VKVKKLGLEDVKSVQWDDNKKILKLVNQKLLPFEFSFVEISTVKEVSAAIRDMTVRGAPAIGVTAGYGIVLALKELENVEESKKEKLLHKSLELLLASRPTAVDLYNFSMEAYNKALETGFSFEETLNFIENLTNKMIEECKEIGQQGASLIEEGDTILTHCNAGPLATVDYGTALAPLFVAKRQGKEFSVLVDETRPRLQGAKITAWELEQEDIKHNIIPDSAASFFMSKKKVNKVILGCDRCLLDGSVTNKIGTLSLAINAKYHNVPFYSAFPWSTIDSSSKTLEDYEIEFRGEDEVKYIKGLEGKVLIANPSSHALNPAFDITPPELLTGYITARGVLSNKELFVEIKKDKK